MLVDFLLSSIMNGQKGTRPLLENIQTFLPTCGSEDGPLDTLAATARTKAISTMATILLQKNKYTNLRSFIKRNSVFVWRVIIPTKPCQMKEALNFFWNKSKPFILEASGKTTHGDEGHFLKRYRHLGDEVEAFIHMKKIFISNSRKNFCLTKAENHYGETIMISRFVS